MIIWVIGVIVFLTVVFTLHELFEKVDQNFSEGGIVSESSEPEKTDTKEITLKKGDKVLDEYYEKIMEVWYVEYDKKGNLLRYRFLDNSYDTSYDAERLINGKHKKLGNPKKLTKETKDIENDAEDIPKSVDVYIKTNYKKSAIKFTYELDLQTYHNKSSRAELEEGILTEFITSRESIQLDYAIYNDTPDLYKEGIQGAIYFYEKQKGVVINPDHILEASVKYNYRPAKVTQTVKTYSVCEC